MSKCSVCEKEFENKYFDVKQNKCILHCEKDDQNGWYTFGLNNTKDWNSVKVKLFWKEIRNIISNSQDRLSKFLPLPFNNIVFPKFEENGLASMETDYENSFFEKKGEKKFTQSIKFSNCTFLSSVDFTNIQFEKDIVFSKCILKDKIYFKRQQNIRISFLNCPEIKNLDFSRIIFEQQVEIKDCVIKSCNFENTRFKDFCHFEESNFSEIKFKNTVFEKLVTFQKTKFKEDVDFYYVTFKTHAIFKNAVFEKTVNFENTLFEVDGSFYGVSSKKDRIELIDVSNRETARIIKNSFEQQNNIIEANKFYALEMEKREKELDKNIKKGENIIEWLIFKIHSISSDHSQSAYLAFLWIFNLSYLYIIYCLKSSVIDNIIAFSAITIILVSMIDMKNALKIGLTIALLEFQVFSNVKLDVIADKINPFSIMISWDEIPFKLLLFKIIIAYLLYQFIVSVRQNTRRK
jgi:uncharacterized protein YjbI with pentapeptide repeats